MSIPTFYPLKASVECYDSTASDLDKVLASLKRRGMDQYGVASIRVPKQGQKSIYLKTLTAVFRPDGELECIVRPTRAGAVRLDDLSMHGLGCNKQATPDLDAQVQQHFSERWKILEAAYLAA